MGPFHSFEKEVNFPILFANCGIFAIGQGTGRSIAQSRHAVGVPTKGGLVGFGRAHCGFERTKLVINHLPNHFIILHNEVRV
jgi:hypothetical protein